MRIFSFTKEEVDSSKSSPEAWHNFVRRREAEMVFSCVDNKKFQKALELGAGDGGQSKIIAGFSDYLICSDLDENSHSWLGTTILQRELPNVEYQILDAQDLSNFPDLHFDLIYSSNLLEHVPDVDRCFSECHRVLKNNGIMLHVMPNRWWKTFHVILSPLKLSIPRVHGVSPNHFVEFYKFGRRVWITRIQKHGFKVTEMAGLPFYVGHRNSFIGIIKAGNKIKIPSSYLFIVEKE